MEYDKFYFTWVEHLCPCRKAAIFLCLVSSWQPSVQMTYWGKKRHQNQRLNILLHLYFFHKTFSFPRLPIVVQKAACRIVQWAIHTFKSSLEKTLSSWLYCCCCFSLQVLHSAVKSLLNDPSHLPQRSVPCINSFEWILYKNICKGKKKRDPTIRSWTGLSYLTVCSRE